MSEKHRQFLRDVDVSYIKNAPENDHCDSCGKTEKQVGWFAKLYRMKELKRGRDDPGNLCGECAGSRDGKRIGEQYP